MDDEQLNIELVKQLKQGRGTTTGFLVRHVGLGQTRGYRMFNYGELPKDYVRRKHVLQKLASFFGVEVTQLLLRPKEAKTA